MSRRRKGVLGKLTGVQPVCYAGLIIGGCRGNLSEEHPVSEALRRGRRIQVDVSVPDGRGGRRTVFSSPPIEIADLSAKILCEGHNGELSPADQEAVRLQAALQESARRHESSVIIPSERVIINGHRFAQFLCKRVVGEFVIHDPSTPPPADLVRYAFGRPTLVPLHFYLGHAVGERPGFGRTDNIPITRIGSPTDPSIAYVTEFEGIRTIITSIAPGDALMKELQLLEGAPDGGWLDRLRAINCPMKGGQVYRIVFDWNDDPYESRVLDGAGLLVTSGA
jgi:hypothetical protein